MFKVIIRESSYYYMCLGVCGKGRNDFAARKRPYLVFCLLCCVSFCIVKALILRCTRFYRIISPIICHCGALMYLESL